MLKKKLSFYLNYNSWHWKIFLIYWITLLVVWLNDWERSRERVNGGEQFLKNNKNQAMEAKESEI